jgi:hypothetical protein
MPTDQLIANPLWRADTTESAKDLIARAKSNAHMTESRALRVAVAENRITRNQNHKM